MCELSTILTTMLATSAYFLIPHKQIVIRLRRRKPQPRIEPTFTGFSEEK